MTLGTNGKKHHHVSTPLLKGALSMKKNTVNIGSRLLEAITKEQVARLLDIVFSHFT
ncbi:MAG TPA: hypothetical protein PLF52_07440 [Syntrophales bacterium]|nr:hypothetical protein [Syntrophales bacterium]